MKNILKALAIVTITASLSLSYSVKTYDVSSGEVSYSNITEYDEEMEPSPMAEFPNSPVVSPNQVIGEDDRVIIDNTTRVPYRYIGKIIVTKETGNNVVGTVLLIRMGRLRLQPSISLRNIKQLYKTMIMQTS